MEQGVLKNLRVKEAKPAKAGVQLFREQCFSAGDWEVATVIASWG